MIWLFRLETILQSFISPQILPSPSTIFFKRIPRAASSIPRPVHLILSVASSPIDKNINKEVPAVFRRKSKHWTKTAYSTSTLRITGTRVASTVYLGSNMPRETAHITAGPTSVLAVGATSTGQVIEYIQGAQKQQKQQYYKQTANSILHSQTDYISDPTHIHQMRTPLSHILKNNKLAHRQSAHHEPSLARPRLVPRCLLQCISPLTNNWYTMPSTPISVHSTLDICIDLR